MGKPIVLVLGAGASRDYGFPLGGQLIDEMCGRKAQIETSLLTAGRPPEQVKVIAERLEILLGDLLHSQVDTVDRFIASRKNSDDREWLQNAVALCFLQMQGQFVVNRLRSRLNGWYPALYDWLFEGGATGDRSALNDVCVVTFNYERSLELALETMYAARHGVPYADGQSKVSQLEILAVHGQIGRHVKTEHEKRGYFPEERGPSGQLKNSAALVISDPLGRASIGTEHNDSRLATAVKRIREAKRVAFMGYGFHPSNNEKLGIPTWGPERPFITTRVGWENGRNESARQFTQGLDRASWYEGAESCAEVLGALRREWERGFEPATPAKAHPAKRTAGKLPV